tara:strand:+ start:579 stop:875 length:297 start_codon:yes stop_codon:yes gene_type:complete
MKGSNLLQIICLTLILLGSHASLAQNEAGEMPVEKVNINLADAKTIALVLDGVGMSRAEAIVEYRDINGQFTTLEELLLVSGIGEVTIRNNQDRISFE